MRTSFRPQSTILRETSSLSSSFKPKYLKSVNCCIELLAVLRMSRRRSVFFMDPTFPWREECDFDRDDLANALTRCKFNVVSTVEDLIREIDERLLIVQDTDADFVREWWHQQPVSESVRLVVRRDEPRSIAGRDDKHWYSLRGRIFLPAGAVTTGLYYISEDGTTAGELIRLPLDLGLAALMILSVVLAAVAPSWCTSCYAYVIGTGNVTDGMPTKTVCTSCDGYFNIFQLVSVLNIRVARQMLKRADIRVRAAPRAALGRPPTMPRAAWRSPLASGLGRMPAA